MKLSPRKRVLILVGSIAVPVLAVIHVVNKPRALAVDEIPIAYWSWRTSTPSPVDLEKAFAITKSKTLFLRAGQFDLSKGDLKRIRPLVGTMPSWVELHLVYNATPDVLRDLDSVDPKGFSKTLVKTYEEDLARSRREGAQVFGLQLDLDYPNRLLPKYAELLREVRQLLPPDTKLSITGLPAWMATVDLADVLKEVDFWIPQLYGASIPTHINERKPISSPSDVAYATSQARRFNKPFYAGLSAYSYAILYGKDGKLLELRGNIDPAAVEQSTNLEQIERRSFSTNGPSETRYEYRARNDLVLDGLIINAGQSVVLDMPNAASLRESARAVRAKAGELLLGICVFRLPAPSDEAVMTIGEVASALSDTETRVATKVTADRNADGRIELRVGNVGTASTILGENAFAIDLHVPSSGAAQVIDTKGFSSYQTLCRIGNDVPRPCGANRANVIRLVSRAWKPTSNATAKIDIATNQSDLNALATTHVDDGRTLTETFELSINKHE